MFYLYTVKDKYLIINDDMTLSLTKDIKKSTSWENKRKANTWNSYVIGKFPDAELKKAILSII